MSRASLVRAIPAGAPLLLDTSAILAYLSGAEAASPAAVELIDGFVQPGRNPATISAVSVGELLVRPFAAGERHVATVELFLQLFPNLSVADVTYEVAREAARVRAETKVSMPDALILATASVRGIGVIVANDDRWAGALAGALPTVGLCRLKDHAA